MDDGKIYRIPQPVFPFLNPLPTPLTPPDDPDSQVCIMLSRNWLPYVRGVIKLFQYDDIWEFPSEQLKNDGQTLIRQFMTPFSCDIGASNVELQAVDLGGGCQQFQWRIDGGVWLNLGVPVCSGQDGENGLPGEDGEDGAPGLPGDDCDCVDPVPVQPIVPVGEDRCQTACNIAFGLGAWFSQNFEDKLDWLEAAFEATTIIVDLAGDFIEAFPVLGAFVDGVINFIQSVAEVDIPALRSENNEAFKEYLQCTLYEIMSDDSDEFTAEYMASVRDELAGILVLLPPQGPLLTLIGQSYAPMLLLFSPNDLLRRANLYKDNEGECDLCDVECGEGETCDPETIVWNETGATPPEWTVAGAISTAGWLGDTMSLEQTYTGARGSMESWKDDNNRIGIRCTLAEPCEISSLFCEYVTSNTNSKRIGLVVKNFTSQQYEVLTNATDETPAPLTFSASWSGAARLVDEILFLCLDGGSASDGVERRISEVRINV